VFLVHPPQAQAQAQAQEESYDKRILLKESFFCKMYILSTYVNTHLLKQENWLLFKSN
jgi:hypothetical protein